MSTQTARHAAKAILEVPDRGIVMVQSTDSKRWSLPGGGIDAGETPVDAAYRELLEEIGLVRTHIAQLYPIGGVWDRVTTKGGISYIARWSLHSAVLKHYENLRPGDGVCDIRVVPITRLERLPKLSVLAQAAISFAQR